ncbi:MAG: hypothetical protein PWP71_2307 [Clostridia bacterium]|nr:hypothetical protein [Clostridia bacterium]
MEVDQLLNELLKTNRHQRHDFLNHLQVIWGFLKLNKNDKAIEYIQEVSNHLQSLRQLNNIASTELAADISAKVLSLGFNEGFKISIPEVWYIEDKNIPKVRSFFNEIWERLINKVMMEKANIVISFLNGKIIIDMQNINGELEYQTIKSIAEKQGIKCLVENGQTKIYVC